MNVHKEISLRLHEDPALFREALTFTAAETRFPPRLIEKDYFCTLLLQHMALADSSLVFRGGTCLAKVHAGFYRLSEDLDFVIPTPIDSSRAERRRCAADSKGAFARVAKLPLSLRVIVPLVGANDSSQYNGVIGYTSLLGSQEETLKIEVGLREPLVTPAVRGEVQTLLLNPLSGDSMVAALIVPCVSRDEAFSEKLRAALSRREAAIRDFYDIDHAVRRLGLDVRQPALLELVRAKLAVPGNEPIDVSDARLAELHPQLESQLKPVLRPQDFADFNLERAFATVADVAGALFEPK